MKICIVVASQGKNMELAREFEKFFSQKNVQTEFINIVDLNLPLYTTKSESSFSAADLAEKLKEHYSVQGYVFVAPEYNGSSPPAFSNFLAWTSRSSKNWRDHFNNRPVVIATHSAGGGLNVLAAMRLQLSYLGMNVLGRQIHTTPQKVVDPASLEIVCNQLIDHSRMSHS